MATRISPLDLLKFGKIINSRLVWTSCLPSYFERRQGYAAKIISNGVDRLTSGNLRTFEES